MTTYEYVVAKLIPDFVKDEPVNIGVLVHEKNSDKSIGRFIDDFSEIKRRNPEININALRRILEGYQGKHEVNSQDYLYRLSKDCIYSLRFTGVCGKKADNPEQAIKELFEEYISIKPTQLSY